MREFENRVKTTSLLMILQLVILSIDYFPLANLYSLNMVNRKLSLKIVLVITDKYCICIYAHLLVHLTDKIPNIL